jgi:hypothetical protein
MTNLDDFDRSLASFLADGPTIAPEAPVVAALAHARTTPRRWDPFAALRRDVMARPVRLGGPRAGLVFAALALVVASIGIAIVGSRPQDSTIPPQPSVGPSSAPSASGSPTPSRPTPSTPAADTQLVLRESGGERATMDIVDGSGHLVSAETVTLGESDAFESLTATNLDARSVKIGWPGSPCDTVHRLTISSTFGLTLDRPKCYGDSVPAFYAIRLVFDEAVDASAMDLGLFDGRIDSGLPTMIVTGLDAAGGRYDLAIYDASGRLVLPEPRSDDTQPPDPGAAGFTLDRISDAVGRLTWRAPACASSPVLRIDTTATDWQLGWSACTPADPTTLRVLDLQFDHLPDTTGITVTIGGPAS